MQYPPVETIIGSKGGIHLRTLDRTIYSMHRCILILLLVLGIAPAHSQSTDAETEKTVSAVVSAVKPSLVRIHCVSVDYSQGREVKRELFGSGVIISDDGLVVTNHHVAGRAKQITCTLADKSQVDAELVGTDALTDIAVIKLTPRDDRKFPAAKFGDSSLIKVGDQVFAMGSPLALSQSVTKGIVSNTEVVMPETMWWMDLTLDGEEVGSVVRWIAHDARIHSGNSGGPLVNMSGEIIGINEISIGLGGAVPGNLAREVAEQLIEHGKVRRSWIGIMIQPLLKSSGASDGVLVGGVVEGSPAEKAGFKPGDMLLKLGGEDCTARFAEEIPLVNHLMMRLPIGSEVEASVLRDGKQINMKVTPADREEARSRPEEFKQWGFCASNITFIAAKEMKRTATNGVLITSLRPGGPSGEAKPRIAENDVILGVAGKPVNNVDDLRSITREITQDKEEPVPVVVTFERKSDQYLTVVKVGITEMSDPGMEVKKAWLPASTQVLTKDIAEALELGNRTGVRITRVYPNSTAEKAGLKTGDIIVALDGIPIPASRPEDTDVFPAMVRQYKIRDNAEFTILRDGSEHKVSVELAESPKLAREMKKYRDGDFEFGVREIGMMDRVDEKWVESQAGVYVESVTEGGWASLGELACGDLIVSVNGESVKGIEHFQQQMEAVQETKSKSVVFRVKRGIRDIYIEMAPTWSAE